MCSLPSLRRASGRGHEGDLHLPASQALTRALRALRPSHAVFQSCIGATEGGEHAERSLVLSLFLSFAFRSLLLSCSPWSPEPRQRPLRAPLLPEAFDGAGARLPRWAGGPILKSESTHLLEQEKRKKGRHTHSLLQEFTCSSLHFECSSRQLLRPVPRIPQRQHEGRRGHLRRAEGRHRMPQTPQQRQQQQQRERARERSSAHCQTGPFDQTYYRIMLKGSISPN